MPPGDASSSSISAVVGRLAPAAASTIAPAATAARTARLNMQVADAHRVVPVDVPVHLVLGEEERLERAHALLVHADLAPRPPVSHQRERREQPVDVHRAVGDAAHARVAAQVVDLVEVERAGDEALERARALAA